MQCKKCFGRGLQWIDEENYGPCPECHGYGIVHCCDGDQPDEAPNLGMIDEPIKRAKVNREVYVVKKETVTGYEMTYAQTDPSPLLKEITEIILGVYSI